MVLLGDACASAHYTVGSGTKLAMESAMSLADALLAQEVLDAQGLRKALALSLQWPGGSVKGDVTLLTDVIARSRPTTPTAVIAEVTGTDWRVEARIDAASEAAEGLEGIGDMALIVAPGGGERLSRLGT